MVSIENVDATAGLAFGLFRSDPGAERHRGLTYLLFDLRAEGVTLKWGTPADIAVGEQVEDLGARIIGTAPPANGTRFAVIDFPPGNEPRMHRTETIDYVIVLEGEIEMDMDDSTVKLRAGDMMVQRGTNHAWANRSDKRARVAFVLIDAVPLGIGHPITGAANAR